MLYIMRHGKTDWNEIKRLQGRSDTELNEEGIAMAEAVREECANIGFDVCFASPLKRAHKTAQIALSGTDVPIILDDRLMEMSFGIYEGMIEAAKEEGSPIRTFFKNPSMYKGVEGGETFEDLFKRTGEFLKEHVYPRLEKGEDVLIVGHGAMNCSIVCQYNDIPLDKFWDIGIPNCKLICLG